MTQEKIYTVEAKQTPSFINKEMAIGLLAACVVPFGGIFLTPLLMLGGAAAGGYIGINRMHAENEHGKQVKPPTIRNSSMLIGGLVGALGGSIFAGAAYVAGAMSAITAVESGIVATAAMSSGTIAAGVVGVGMLTGGLVLLGCIGAGLLIGGWIGKKKMAKEYAEAQTNDLQLAQAAGKSRALALEAAVGAPDMQQEFSYRDKISAERGKINGLPRTVR